MFRGSYVQQRETTRRSVYRNTSLERRLGPLTITDFTRSRVSRVKRVAFSCSVSTIEAHNRIALPH